MLAKLRRLLASAAPDPQHSDTLDLQLAAAALLVDVARSDYRRDPQENEALRKALRQCFDLDTAAVEDLLDRAEVESQRAVGVYPFTALVNEQCSEAEKIALVRQLWEVAAADGDIDKYEDHLIRKISDLLYVSHSQFIRTKLEALGTLP